ncbi:GrpB family protein [Enterococcus sp. BWB1-3]|uniref:GrpB family protein n=1 Tax=Enterococcus sp. BWB1-3 TaxID=2787713 RepID=UPI001F274839|nr:GrpB family protein [Enterococcus sp. BWB1-3]MBL1230479.1 GrpB family protein [Enterococcus sp. BWB1-3]
MVRKIEVVPYNPFWPSQFLEEKKKITEVLPAALIINIIHIGSTSVPNLAAKPVIDISLIVDDINQLDQYINNMAELGYECWGEYGLPGRRYFQNGGDERTHQVHAYQYDNLKEIGRHVAFRDYLRTHPKVASEYGAIKMEAANQNPTDIDGYMAYKDEFVKKFEKEALKWIWKNK